LIKLQYVFVYILGLAPIIGYISVNYFDVAYYNLLSLIVSLIFISLLLNTLNNSTKIILPKYLIYFMCFVLYTIFSDILLVGKTVNIRYYYSNHLIASLLAMIIIENTFFSKQFINRLNRINYSILVLAFIIILLQQVISPTLLTNISSSYYRTISESYSQHESRLLSIYSWTSILDIGFGFIGISTLMISQRLKNNRNIIITSLFVIFVFIFSIITKWRWIMVNSVFILLLILIKYKSSFRKIMIYSIILFGGLILCYNVMENLGIPIKDIIEKRILESESGGFLGGSSNTRILAFVIFAKLFPDNPIFGKGMMHSFEGKSKDIKLSRMIKGNTSQIHVGYLSCLYYYGIVGFIPFIFFIINLESRMRGHAKSTGDWGPHFVLLGFIVSNFTLVNFSYIYFGLLIGLVYYKYSLDISNISIR
jgi:hypothetical protein